MSQSNRRLECSSSGPIGACLVSHELPTDLPLDLAMTERSDLASSMHIDGPLAGDL